MPGRFDETVHYLDVLMRLYNTWTFDETVQYLDVLMVLYTTWMF